MNLAVVILLAILFTVAGYFSHLIRHVQFTKSARDMRTIPTKDLIEILKDDSHLLSGHGFRLLAAKELERLDGDLDRVKKYIVDLTGIGYGDDPIGFLIASHAALVHERMELKARKDDK